MSVSIITEGQYFNVIHKNPSCGYFMELGEVPLMSTVKFLNF